MLCVSSHFWFLPYPISLSHTLWPISSKSHTQSQQHHHQHVQRYLSSPIIFTPVSTHGPLASRPAPVDVLQVTSIQWANLAQFHIHYHPFSSLLRLSFCVLTFAFTPCDLSVYIERLCFRTTYFSNGNLLNIIATSYTRLKVVIFTLPGINSIPTITR